MNKRWFCSRCHVELTDADREAGECTQCHRALPTRDHKFIDVTAPQLQQEFRISYDRGKQIQEVLNRYLTTLKESLDSYDFDPFLYPKDMRDEMTRDTEKDIDYITELAKEFD